MADNIAVCGLTTSAAYFELSLSQCYYVTSSESIRLGAVAPRMPANTSSQSDGIVAEETDTNEKATQCA